MSGHTVSHSNIKTKRKFLPNVQVFSLHSDALNVEVRFNATPSTIRSIEHNNGIDQYLLKTPANKLCSAAKNLKKKLVRVLKNQSGSRSALS